jgi:cell wall-associated NlpC family hydrolase
MQCRAKSIFAVVVCTLILHAAAISRAQDPGGTRFEQTTHGADARQNHAHSKTLSKHDRSSVITVALHTKKVRHVGGDCSHLVHSIYQRAGFPYTYADSDELYAGAEGFRRVSRPEPADLVVWHGHVGIVIRPAGHEFFSLLSTGPGVDSYRSRYWKSRGQPRFYRYVKRESWIVE